MCRNTINWIFPVFLPIGKVYGFGIQQKNLKYLQDEIELAQPKVILLLGEEVTSVVMNVSRALANRLLQSECPDLSMNKKPYKIVASPHPGILMRQGEAGGKWRKISERQLERLKPHLKTSLFVEL